MNFACSLTGCRRHLKNEACEPGLTLFPKLLTSVRARKKNREDGGAVEKKKPKRKKNVLPLLCTYLFFFETWMRRWVGWDKKENLHGIHSFGLSNEKFSFSSASSRRGRDSVSTESICGASLLRGSQQFWRVGAPRRLHGETPPTCPAV